MVLPIKITGRPLRDIAGTALYLPVRAVLPAMSEAQTDPTPVRQEQAVAPGLQRLRFVGTATAKTVTVGAEGLQVVLMAAASEAAPVEAVLAVTVARLPRQLQILQVPEEITAAAPAGVDLTENTEVGQAAQSITELPGAVNPAQQEPLLHLRLAAVLPVTGLFVVRRPIHTQDRAPGRVRPAPARQEQINLPSLRMVLHRRAALPALHPQRNPLSKAAVA